VNVLGDMKGPAVSQIDDKSDPDVASAREDRHFVTALARGLEVLVCFRRGEAFLANQDTAERCNRPRSTVSRLTHTLSRIGYLHCVEEIGQYRRGTALISLSSTALGGLDVRKIARPAMRDLADVSKASVGLGVRERLSMCYVECLRSSAATSLSNDVGSRISAATSAMGRAYIAVRGAEEGAAIYDSLKGEDYFAWPQLRDGLDKEMDEYRTLGCCTSFDEWQDTVSAIALGFRPGGGLPAMTINCGAPTVIT
jgi:DNA-binding IclR family transcriptional regulator